MNTGVIYYKLQDIYPGDFSKGCGLTGNEIDSNFYFLRGFDIKSGEYDPETGKLTLKRVNQDDIIINLSLTSGTTLLPDYNFSFDDNNGILTIEKSDGTIVELSGFSKNDIADFAVDNTLLGNGNNNNPLRLNPIERTGTVAPANVYIDLTNSGSSLPNASKGYRVVTKEYLNVFGNLYDYQSVENINTDLAEEGHGWHVPTKDEFNELFNSLECDGFKNHSGNTPGYYGKVAGQALKSTILWKPANVSVNNDDTVGLDTVGLTIYPCGWGGINSEIGDEFTETASLWTTSKYDNNMIIVKNFHYDSNQIEQNNYTPNTFHSIRLVKDYDGHNYSEIETILNASYSTVRINNKIWTKINFFNKKNSYNYIPVEENSDLNGLGTVYYINEWDGAQWVKKQLNEGDSVVILEKDDTEYREWRIKNGELYDIFGEDFNEELESLKNSIHSISGMVSGLSINVMNSILSIEETLSEHQSSISGITESINNLSAYVQTIVENEIMSLEARLQEYTDNAVNQLQQHIEQTLTNTIKNTVRQYLSGVTNEIQITPQNDKLLIGFSENALFG